MVIMSGPAGERGCLALFADSRDLVEDVWPFRLPREPAAYIGSEVGELAIVEHRSEARHQRAGFAVARPDSVQHDMEEVVRLGIVRHRAQGKRYRPRDRQAGSAMMTGRAGAGEDLAAAGCRIGAGGERHVADRSDLRRAELAVAGKGDGVPGSIRR